jgi:5-(hydroxymethyl)furfural/furfural oxidase
MATPMTNLPSGRISSAMAYLTAAVRSRPNLDIRADAPVEALVVDGRQVTGVTLRGGQVVAARETIVAAGAIHSPALLMRSGIGPASALRAAGIAVAHDLPGVGQNLLNHPALYFATHLGPAMRQPRHQRAWSQNSLRYSSGVEGCPGGDMLLFAFNKTAWHALGRAVGAVNVAVYKSFSRGSVMLSASGQAPEVRFALLSDPRDRERLVAGTTRAIDLLDPRVQAARNEAFVAKGYMAQKLAVPRLRSAVTAALIAAVLDGPSRLRRHLLRNDTLDLEALRADRDAVEQMVDASAFPMGHVSGTCRIGAAGDSMAVLDPACRVRGMQGLRVIDASIMPTIPRANTHVPTLMIGERGARAILEDRP